MNRLTIIRLSRSLSYFNFVAVYSGITAPPEINIFIPSPTDMESGKISCGGSIKRNPLVGFGVVGTKTLVNGLPRTSTVSPEASFVRKPMT